MTLLERFKDFAQDLQVILSAKTNDNKKTLYINTVHK